MARKVYTEAEREARKEYTRLRAIANKRIARLEKAGFENNYRRFPTLKELGDLSDRQLASARAFVNTPWTKSGVRREYYKQEDKKTAEALQAHGYNIPPSAIKGFTRFMENWRRQEMAKGKRFRASDQTAQVFENALKLGVSPDEIVKHMKAFINHADELAQMEIPKDGEGLSFNQIRNKWNYAKAKADKQNRRNTGTKTGAGTKKKKK